MKSSVLLLESFDDDAPDAGVMMRAAHLEDAKLEAFEKGYTAGWDDAVAAAASDQKRIGADLARNLQALSFTYLEARNHVLGAMEPLLHDMVAKVLPQAARVSLGAILAETLLPLAREIADVPVRVEINPNARDAVAPAFESIGFPVELIDEPTLGEGQAYLRLGETARAVDLDAVINAIGSAVTGYFESQNGLRKHG